MDNNENKTKPSSTNYDLKSEAVEALANADTEETPVYSQEELNKYRSKKGFHIPEPVKVLFIKAWFAGAVCYFFFWGLGTYVGGLIDMLFILAVALGMVTDLLTNNVLRFLEKTNGDCSKWLMVTKKGIAGFFLNILYGFPITFCVYMLYDLINRAADGLFFLGVEPVLFGVFCMGFDLAFVTIKRTVQSIIADAKKTAGEADS